MRRFRPGESPFHCKGSIYGATQRFFEARGRSLPDLLRKHDPELARFMEQKFLPVGWYDALPMPELSRLEARCLNMPLRAYLKERCDFQAKHDLTGVYRVLFKVLSPKTVALRLPDLAKQMYDFGEVSTEDVSATSITAHFSGFPAPLWEVFTVSFTFYTACVLEMAGAEEPRVTPSPARPSGAHAGVPLVDATLTASW